MNEQISRPSDLDAVWPDVLRLLQAVHEYHQPLLGFDLVEDWAERQRSFFDPGQPGVLLLLASVDDRPVGLLNGRLLRDPSIFRELVLTIDNMYVVPEMRRAGIGRRLLAAAADWGRSEGRIGKPAIGRGRKLDRRALL